MEAKLAKKWRKLVVWIENLGKVCGSIVATFSSTCIFGHWISSVIVSCSEHVWITMMAMPRIWNESRAANVIRVQIHKEIVNGLLLIFHLMIQEIVNHKFTSIKLKPPSELYSLPLEPKTIFILWIPSPISSQHLSFGCLLLTTKFLGVPNQNKDVSQSMSQEFIWSWHTKESRGSSSETYVHSIQVTCLQS